MGYIVEMIMLRVTLSWIRIETPTKSVLLQIFSGTLEKANGENLKT